MGGRGWETWGEAEKELGRASGSQMAGHNLGKGLETARGRPENGRRRGLATPHVKGCNQSTSRTLKPSLLRPRLVEFLADPKSALYLPFLPPFLLSFLPHELNTYYVKCTRQVLEVQT